MSRPAFQRVEELFHQTVALAPPERPAFLEAACAGDADLRGAVEDLLRQDEGGQTESFLVSPVAGAAERLRAPSATLADAGQGQTSSVPPPLPHIPGYEVLKERGRGGMGVVYQARQLVLNRVVALKMLLPHSAAAPDLLARFRTEAEALARLPHPNIVPIYDVGEYQGRPYFTLEYVAGPNLAEYLAGRPQEAAAAAHLLEVLARTLHTVHQAGLIHRDLKPANILLQREETTKPTKTDTEDNRPAETETPLLTAVPLSASALREMRGLRGFTPKITDFGLVKDQTAEQKLTQSGMAMGTPCYMAPEQARPRLGSVGPAADLYALGAVLYELLTGRPPFEADTPAETIALMLNEEPLSPARLRPGLPPDLVTICLKCLEKSPRQRYASAADLAEDLRRFQAGQPIRARPVGPVERCYRWCRRRPLVAALLALSALLLVAFVATVLVYEVRLRQALARTEDRAEQEQKKAEQEQKELVLLSVERGVTALEDEDTFTAVFCFTEALRLDQGGPEFDHRTRIATTLRQCPQLLGRQTLEGPIFREAPLSAALSPDGRSLAVAGGRGTVQVWDLGTGASRELAVERSEGVRRLAFQPDGRLRLVQYGQGVLRSWDLAGRDAVPLQEFSPGTRRVAATFATLSDNGRWLFTLDANHRGEMWDVETGVTRVVLPRVGSGMKMGAVSAEGRRLALVGPDQVLTVWDVPLGHAVGTTLALPRDINQVVFSADGERVLTTGGNRTAQVWQVSTGTLQAAWSRLDSVVTDAHFSPDGRLVLLGDGAGAVRVWDAVTGQAVTPPLRQGGRLAWAAFHDNGQQVVTVSTRGTVCFWRLPHAPEVSADAAADEAADAGGARLRPFGCLLEDGVRVAADPVTAGSLRPPRVADRVVEHAAFSPDGSRVVVCAEDSTVRVWDTATGTALTPPLRHGGAVLYGAFSPDGRLLVTASADQTARVWDAATGEVLAPPLRHPHAIQRVFFRGERACVVQEGGAVTAWDLTPEERSRDELLALVRELVSP